VGGGSTAIPSARRQPPIGDPERWVFCEAQQEVDVSFEDLLIALIIAGIGLSGVYVRAEYVLWRRNQAAERSKEVRLRELHCLRLCHAENDVPVSIAQLEK
jgi:hypothetical protein